MRFKSVQIILLLAAGLLSGCGFTLRGSVDLPPHLQTLMLESTDRNSDIMREMRRTLIASNVTIVDQPREGIYRLGIGDEESGERVVSVNANARAGEYELSVSVPFQVRSGTDIVLGPETLTVEKIYLADPENAVAKAEEANLIRGEMRRELVNRIMRRLQTASL